MKYINITTKEIYETPGDVRKALAPKQLPKVLTKAVLEVNGLDYFYEGVEPKMTIFQRAIKNGIKQNEKGLYTYDYIIEDIFSEEEKVKITQSTSESVKKQKIEELKTQLEKYIEEYVYDTPLSEQISWNKQESEAREYLKDNNAPTPYIDALLASRNKGENKLDLINKIITKADAYSVFHGTLLGKLHTKLLEVNDFVFSVETISEDLERFSGIRLDLNESEEQESNYSNNS